MPTPEELLDQLHADLAAIPHDEAATGVDRRQFMFQSLVVAAATTFGASAAQAQRALSYGTVVGVLPDAPIDVNGVIRETRSLFAQPEPPVPLGNGEAPALQFLPYPGGTGALMEKLARERGARRSSAPRSRWSRSAAPCPPTPTTSRFLPAHRLVGAHQGTQDHVGAAHRHLPHAAQAAQPDAALRRDDHGRRRRAREAAQRRRRDSRPATIAARCTACRTA